MPEKNIFNKDLGRYQTRAEWDDWEKGRAARTEKYTGDWNKYGSDKINWGVSDGTGYAKAGYDGGNLYSTAQGIGDDAYKQILSFESGQRGWDTLGQGVKDWYQGQGFDIGNYDQQHRYETQDALDEWPVSYTHLTLPTKA